MSDAPAALDVKGLGKHKKALMVVGGGAAVYVLWSYYRASQAAKAAAAAAATTAPTDDGYVTQATGGAAGQYSGTTASQGDYAGAGDIGTAAPTTNAAWTQLAVELLTNSGYDAVAVTMALGKFLTRQPLNDQEQQFVRSALAVAGPPPSGSYVIIPAVTSTPAPSNPDPAPSNPAPSNPAPSNPAPAPVVHRYPEMHFWYTNQPNDNYGKIAAKFGLGISGDELFQYQFGPQADRPASTLADMRRRNPPTTIYAGGSTAIPYPR